MLDRCGFIISVDSLNGLTMEFTPCPSHSGSGSPLRDHPPESWHPSHRGVWRHLAHAAARHRPLPDRLHQDAQADLQQRGEETQVRATATGTMFSRSRHKWSRCWISDVRFPPRRDIYHGDVSNQASSSRKHFLVNFASRLIYHVNVQFIFKAPFKVLTVATNEQAALKEFPFTSLLIGWFERTSSVINGVCK